MIREDRIQLNERFRKVFAILEERGEILPNDRNGRGIGDFAERILGNRAYGHIIRAFLNPEDKRVIDYRHARALCNEYGVNESYLIDGEGTPFGFDVPKNNIEATDAQLIGNILFTSKEAFAGSSVDVGGFAAEDHEFFSVPGLSGSGLVAFPINGNSMEPVINDGDTVICREISSAQEIKDNKIYAVKSNGSLWVKYVQKIFDKNGRVVELKMISANHLEHDPFVEDVNEYTRLYKVIRKIADID
ncbi:MAG TPA: S24 family peptidase [Saprospiraceae bacterium]|nr:S24 family peptidase [Saprospiraceae bacterium]